MNLFVYDEFDLFLILIKIKYFILQNGKRGMLKNYEF